jgi:cytochrome c-type biogenesis protein CcmH
MRRMLFLLLALMLLAASALAVEPDEMLKDPALEARARALAKTLRCMVCQNQSIDDSEAPLARDLRILLRERLQAGDSDEAVRDFLVARYGEFVLLQPRLKGRTAPLWAVPILALLGGGAALWFFLRRRRTASPAALTQDEKRKLAKLMRDHEDVTKL